MMFDPHGSICKCSLCRKSKHFNKVLPFAGAVLISLGAVAGFQIPFFSLPGAGIHLAWLLVTYMVFQKQECSYRTDIKQATRELFQFLVIGFALGLTPKFLLFIT